MSLRVDQSGQSRNISFEPQSAAEKKEPDFTRILEQTRVLQKRELEYFLQRLDTQGKKLAESMSLEDLFAFKNMVRDFLKTTLGKCRTMQEETVWDYSGQPRVMARVTKIDRALEELGEQVLSSQVEPLKVLAKIDEIRGLIIDLLA